MATAGRGMSLGGAGASWRKGASPSSSSSRNRSSSLMKALGAPVVNCDRAGPVGQLGYAQAMLLFAVAGMFLGEETVEPEGEGQPMEMGDDEAEEPGEYEKFIFGSTVTVKMAKNDVGRLSKGVHTWV